MDKLLTITWKNYWQRNQETGSKYWLPSKHIYIYIYIYMHAFTCTQRRTDRRSILLVMCHQMFQECSPIVQMQDQPRELPPTGGSNVFSQPSSKGSRGQMLPPGKARISAQSCFHPRGGCLHMSESMRPFGQARGSRLGWLEQWLPYCQSVCVSEIDRGPACVHRHT